MVFFILLFLFIGVVGIRFAGDEVYYDAFKKEKNNAIKGIFIVIVFINHIKEYYVSASTDLTAWYDAAFFLPAKAFGQLMVVMFLFYSGYGVAESIKSKGKRYIQNIPKKRVLGTLLNFDVAVLIFAITCLLIDIDFSFSNFLLSLVGWSDVGNSNWYIFCIIVCYSLTFISYSLSNRWGGYLMLVFIVVYFVIMSCYKGTWWYNTVLAYGAGIFVSEHKEWLINQWKREYFKWCGGMLAGFLVCLGTYLAFYEPFKSNMETIGAMVFNAMSVFFAFLVVLITMKVSVYNSVLVWLGMNLFPIYIYQRLPMMVLSHLYPDELVSCHPYLFLVLCMGITGCIVWGYKFIQVKLA